MSPIPKIHIALLLTLLSLASFQLEAQSSVKIVESYSATPQKYQRYDLSIHEKVDKSRKLALMQKVAAMYPQYAEEELWPNKYMEYFHFMDLDLDGDMDLIFDGWSGAEPMMVEISLQIDSKFKSKFKGFVDLIDLKMKDGKLKELKIYDPGCCSAIIAHEVHYEFKIMPDFLDYWIIEHLEFHNATAEPHQYFETPLRFEVVNEPYVLRITAETNSNRIFYAEDPKRNVYQKLKRGDKGTAYAEKRDASGKTWWYVYMDTKNRPSNKVRFPEDYFPKYKGWINSSTLKKE